MCYIMLLYCSADTSTGWLQVLLKGKSKHKSLSGVEVPAFLEIKDNTLSSTDRELMCPLSVSKHEVILDKVSGCAAKSRFLSMYCIFASPNVVIKL